MNRFAAFFRLLRWKNLLIVLLTQLFIWGFVIHPLTAATHQQFFLTFQHLLLLSSSMLLIIAGGYLINDYYDVAIDQINKPQAVIIGKYITKQSALFIYCLLNLAGIVLSFYLAYALGNPLLALIQVFCAVLLWLYSALFKRTYLLGNILVALIIALTLLILVCYEPKLYAYWHQESIRRMEVTISLNPLKLILMYAFFAFMVTFMREIVKDVQDMEGDKIAHCKTLPIVSGEKAARQWIKGLCILVIWALVEDVYLLFHGKWIILAVYLVVALILPLAWIFWQLSRQHTYHLYKRLSAQLKQIMVLGLIPLLLYYLLNYVFSG